MHVATQTDLKLGLRGSIEGESVEVVGWTRYRMNEGGEWYYWEEWLLKGTNHTYWLNFDQDTQDYILYHERPPVLDKHPSTYGGGDRIKYADTTYVVAERGVAELVELGGELPWNAQIGEIHDYIDAKNRSERLSIEWSGDEVEVAVGFTTTRKKILRWFDLQEVLANVIHEEKSKIHWKNIHDWISGFFLIGIALALFSFFNGSKTLISKQTVTLCSTDATTNEQSECNSTIIGPFKLGKENRVVQIEIKSKTVTQGNWPYLTVELINENDQPQRAFAGDFWSEYWKEGGESGVETNSTENVLVKLTKPGNYFLYLELEKDALHNEFNQDVFEVAIYDSVLLSRYFLGFTGLSFSILYIKNKWYVHG